MNQIAVILERFAELVEGKMAVSKAAQQVAEEVRALEEYCNYNRISIPPGSLKTSHLKAGKYK